MAIYRFSATLVDLENPTTGETTGDSYAMIPSDADAQTDGNTAWKFWYSLDVSDLPSGAQLQVKCETSWDGDNWIPQTSFLVTSSGVNAGAAGVDLGLYVRGHITYTGDAPTYAGKLGVACTSPIRGIAT